MVDGVAPQPWMEGGLDGGQIETEKNMGKHDQTQNMYKKKNRLNPKVKKENHEWNDKLYK